MSILSRINTEIVRTERTIERIVESGGRVTITDPLSTRLIQLRRERNLWRGVVRDDIALRLPVKK